jgi:hypothetical protein
MMKCPAKKTQHCTVTQINRLTLFKEIIAVCGESQQYINAKYIITDCWTRWDIYLSLSFKGLIAYYSQKHLD